MSSVDTDSVPSICRRLGEIEDALAELQPRLAEAAGWRVRLKSQQDRWLRTLLPKQEGRTGEERKANALALIEGEVDEEGRTLPERLCNAESAYAEHMKTFESLDSRRSILQSILKSHLREQEPRFGQGAHHGEHRAAA